MRQIIVQHDIEFFEEVFNHALNKHFITLDEDELEFILSLAQMMTERDKGYYLTILLRLIGDIE